METLETNSLSKEWRDNYATAIRYCMKFAGNRANAEDLVHESYCKWKVEKNEDLFTKNKYQILRIIKNIHYNDLQRRSYMWRGKIYRKRFTNDVPCLNGDIETYENTVQSLNFKYGYPVSSQHFESEDIISFILKSLSDFDQKVLKLKQEGYKHFEIEKILNRTNPIITASVNNIKEKMKTVLLNPFNCSKVKVVKRVSRKTFDAHPENYKDFEKGEFYEYNEYYTLLTSKENPNEGLLVKEESKDWYIS